MPGGSTSARPRAGVDTYSRATHRPRSHEAPRARRPRARRAAGSRRSRGRSHSSSASPTTTPSNRRTTEGHDEHAAHAHALEIAGEQVVEWAAQRARRGERLDLRDHPPKVRREPDSAPCARVRAGPDRERGYVCDHGSPWRSTSRRKGLLEGAPDERARGGRLELLRTLEREGFGLEELRRATPREGQAGATPCGAGAGGRGTRATPRRSIAQETGLEMGLPGRRPARSGHPQSRARRARTDRGGPRAGPQRSRRC